MSDFQNHRSRQESTSAPRSRRTIAASLGAVGLVALSAVAAAQAQAGSQADRSAAAHVYSGALTDLQPAAAGPLDGARARLVFVEHGGSSSFVLVVSGVGTEGIGHTFGAHLHTRSCVAGDGAAAGPHYNQSTIEGVVPPVVSDQTEVWLDVTVGAGGNGVAVAKVPFVPIGGTHAVVLHADHTDDHGTAGPRLACLPVRWS
jgi:superoxide dismutase, Cu-Zn family